jgi:hypothetical protein
VSVLSAFRFLFLSQLARRQEKTLFQRCLAVHIAGASAQGALS